MDLSLTEEQELMRRNVIRMMQEKVAPRAAPRGDGYVINGNKRFITHAEVGGPFTVFAKVEVDGKDRISAFIVDRDTPGLIIGRNEKKMGLRGSLTGEITLENVYVPGENLLGKVGDGLHIALDCLDKGRIMVGAMGCRPGPRGPWSTQRPGSSSANPSASTRPSSSCWQTWRPPSRPGAAWCTRRPGSTTLNSRTWSAFRP